ncbi:MAG: DnaD domain protein [Defluviitaleaceae bacterium]|nr:DnaD domain protein [Defluviitaleaceae bacterium]
MAAMRMKLGYESPTMAVPCPFIDHYMNTCPPVYALVYIYSLRRTSEGNALTMGETAAHFNILESDVYNAWRYWENAGIVLFEGTAPDVAVTFLPQEQWGKKKNEAKAVKSAISGERPGYDAKELELYKKNSGEVERLFKHAEKTLGLVKYTDLNMVFGLYDWLRIPIDVIEYLLSYCADKGIRNLNYIESCALDWYDNGITTVSEAEEYSQTFFGEYRDILQAMGQRIDYPTPMIKKHIDKWRKEWNIPISLIIEACERSEGIQLIKSRLKHMNTTIESWHKAGITTIEGVQVADEEHARVKETVKAPARVVKPRASRFANFTQRKNDYTKFEQLQRDYILKELQG